MPTGLPESRSDTGSEVYSPCAVAPFHRPGTLCVAAGTVTVPRPRRGQYSIGFRFCCQSQNLDKTCQFHVKFQKKVAICNRIRTEHRNFRPRGVYQPPRKPPIMVAARPKTMMTAKMTEITRTAFLLMGISPPFRRVVTGCKSDGSIAYTDFRGLSIVFSFFGNWYVCSNRAFAPLCRLAATSPPKRGRQVRRRNAVPLPSPSGGG